MPAHWAVDNIPRFSAELAVADDDEDLFGDMVDNSVGPTDLVADAASVIGDGVGGRAPSTTTTPPLAPTDGASGSAGSGG